MQTLKSRSSICETIEENILPKKWSTVSNLLIMYPRFYVVLNFILYCSMSYNGDLSQHSLSPTPPTVPLSQEDSELIQEVWPVWLDFDIVFLDENIPKWRFDCA